MTFGSGSNGCLGHGNFNDVTQVHVTRPLRTVQGGLNNKADHYDPRWTLLYKSVWELTKVHLLKCIKGYIFYYFSTLYLYYNLYPILSCNL